MSTVVALYPRPCLCLAHECPQLGEEPRRLRRPAVERLDPLQPPQHTRCFFHAANVATKPSRVCDGSVTNVELSRQAAPGWTRAAILWASRTSAGTTAVRAT